MWKASSRSHRRCCNRAGWVLLAALLVQQAPAAWGSSAAQGSRHYFYLSDKRVVTLELIDESTVILNYINLSDTIAILRAPNVVVRESGGGEFRGHVIDTEGQEEDRYKVSQMIKPRQLGGISVLGSFRFESPPSQAFLKIGGRVMELESITAEEFDVVASRVGEMDFQAVNTKRMIESVGFRRGFGDQHRAGGDRYAELRLLFPDLDLLPPVIVKGPRPLLPRAFAGLSEPVVVRLEAGVSRTGGLYNVQVRKGVDPKLDQIAIDAVRNTWTVLPAISKSEVADSTAVLNVLFDRPAN